MDYSFEWDKEKNTINQLKHGVSFEDAQAVFTDVQRVIYEDVDHSTLDETRYKCIGKIGEKICTVRFTENGGKPLASAMGM